MCVPEQGKTLRSSSRGCPFLALRAPAVRLAGTAWAMQA